MEPVPSAMHSFRGSNGHPSLFPPFDPCSEHAHQRDRVRQHRQRARRGHGGRELRGQAGVSTHTQSLGMGLGDTQGVGKPPQNEQNPQGVKVEAGDLLIQVFILTAM